MAYCEDCGARADTQALRCKSCGGRMELDAPIAPPPSQYAAQPAAAGLPGFAPGRELSDDQERFLDEFSWGPGCGIYFWSRAMLIFLLISVVLRAVDAALTPALDDPNVDTGTLLLSLLVVGAMIALLVFAGKVARRRRWSMLKWRDFEHFRADENSWQIFGIIGWVIFGLVLIGGIIGGMLLGATRFI